MSTRRLHRAGGLPALIAAAALVATGCGSGQPSTAPTATGGGPATQAPVGTATPAAATPVGGGGGTLGFAIEASIKTLDPAIAYDSSALPAVNLLFERLVGYDSGTTLVPQLATAMPTVSADGTVYTFTLRSGVKFVKPDGSVLREVTAKDVVASLNRLLDPNLKPTPCPVAGAIYTVIKGAADVVAGRTTEASGLRAIDDHTVEITLVHASGAFLNVMAMTFASIIPADVAGADTEAFSKAPVGTGPYLLREVRAGQSYTFVRNPAYWNPGRQHVDTIDYRVNVTANTQLQQVQAGQLDIMGNDIPAGAWGSVRADPRWSDLVHVQPLVATEFLWLNTGMTDTPLANEKVRQAIAYAIDKDNILKIVGEGRAVKATQIFPPPMPGYQESYDPYPRDVGKAKALLAEAGVATGFRTRLYADTLDLDKSIVQSIQQDLAGIGITADIVQQPLDVLVGTIFVPKTVPLTYIGWAQDYPDPSDFIDPILSCATAVKGGSNASFYCDPQTDALAAAANVERDPATRIKKYRDVEARIMAAMPGVPIFYPVSAPLVAERVTGFAIHPVWLFDLASYGLTQ